VIFDLEDSVPTSEKERARECVSRVVRSDPNTAGCEIHVRVNRGDAGYDRADLEAAVVSAVAGIRLPKVESSEDVQKADQVISDLESERGLSPGSVRVYPTIESASAVLASSDIAGACDRIDALVFGPADFAVSVGVYQPSFESALVGRSMLVLASSAAGLGRPIDGAFLDLDDSDLLRQHCDRVCELGFGGKSAIHPRQVSVINQAFTPSPPDIERARNVLEIADSDTSVGVVEGAYIDAPVIAQARAIVEFSERIESREG